MHDLEITAAAARVYEKHGEYPPVDALIDAALDIDPTLDGCEVDELVARIDKRVEYLALADEGLPGVPMAILLWAAIAGFVWLMFWLMG